MLGILAVEDKYEFVAHEGAKDGNHWSNCYKYRLTPEVKCPAKARVVKFDEKWILQHADDHEGRMHVKLMRMMFLVGFQALRILSWRNWNVMIHTLLGGSERRRKHHG